MWGPIERPTAFSHQPTHQEDSLDSLDCLDPLMVSPPKKVGYLPFVAHPDVAVPQHEEPVAPPKLPRLLQPAGASDVYIRRSETQVSLNIPGFRPGFPSWQGIRVGQGLPLPPPDRSNVRGSAGPSPRPLHHCSCRDVSLADVLSCIRELKNIDLGQIIISDYLIISDVIFSSFT